MIICTEGSKPQCGLPQLHREVRRQRMPADNGADPLPEALVVKEEAVQGVGPGSAVSDLKTSA